MLSFGPMSRGSGPKIRKKAGSKKSVAKRSKKKDVPITGKEIAVTPEMALEWVTEKNHNNRPILPARLRRYSKAMREGRHQRGVVVISFDTNGNLLNGQHTLQAMVETDTTLKLFVRHDVPPEAFVHMDTGAVRGGKDVLGIAGYSNSKNLAPAARYASHILAVDEGRMGYGSIGKVHMPNDKLLEWVGAHQGIEESTALLTSRAAQTICSPPSLFRALHWFLSRVEHNDAADFFERLASGLGAIEGDPVHALREALLAERARSSKLGARPPWYWVAVTIKAWNAFREGKEVHRLGFRTAATGGSSKMERWPSPI